MYICLNCKSVFDEADIEERIIDKLYGEYGGIPKAVCPRCGCAEIAEAFKCEICGEWFDSDLKETDGNMDLCAECYKGIEDAAVEKIESPYASCENVNQVVGKMFGGLL